MGFDANLAMESIRHAQLDTVLGADSVALLGEPSPSSSDDSVSQHAVVGTYSLSDGAASHGRERLGRLLVVKAERHGETCSLTQVSQIDDLPGVLDVQAAPREVPSPRIFAACAEDSLFSFDAGLPQAGKHLLHKQRLHPAEAVASRIILSVDSVPDPSSASDTLVAASDSLGGLSLFRAGAHGSQHVASLAGVHTEEAWSVCVSSCDAGGASGPTLYSGGDDGALCISGAESDAARVRVRGAHGGVGVTAVAQDAAGGATHEVWTGGYDDVVRLWDVRAMREAVAEVGVGGGVWRVRFHPRRRDMVLVATMYDGFKVVRREAGSDELAVACGYEGHESLGYGAAWVPALDRGEEECVALTGSFYDHSLQLWSVMDVER